MEILAVTGTNGSGKGTFVKFLEELGYKHFSARELLLQEIQKHKLLDDRTAMQKIGNMLRKEYGPDYIARELLRCARESDAEKVVIESIRCPGEVHFLKNAGAILIAVDDLVEVRYQRILKRAHSTDNVTLEEFIEQEKREWVGSQEWDMNVPLCIKEADYVFAENGDIDSFRDKVRKWQSTRVDYLNK